MPTLRDGRLLILALAAFVFARIAGGTLPWFLFYASFGLVALAFGWAWYLGRTLDCQAAADRHELAVGEEVRLRVRLENNGFLPLPWVEVENGTTGLRMEDPAPLAATSAGAFSTRVAEFRMRARRRGHFPLGPVRVTTGDPLGLFEVCREVTSPDRVTIFPRVIRLERLPVPLNHPFGHVRTRKRAFTDPSHVAEIRPYRPGDSPRHIHWVTSARRGQLHLREYELNATTQLAVFLDLCQNVHTRGPGGDTLEAAVEVATALADLAARQGFEFGLWAVERQRRHVPVSMGGRALRQALAVLARVEGDGHLPMDRVLQTEAAGLPGRCAVAVITPAVTTALAEVMLRLRPMHPLLLVAIKAETFAGLPPSPAAAARDRLCRLLTLQRVAVYPFGAGDDLRRLADLQLRPGRTGPEASAGEGVEPWPRVQP